MGDPRYRFSDRVRMWFGLAAAFDPEWFRLPDPELAVAKRGEVQALAAKVDALERSLARAEDALRGPLGMLPCPHCGTWHRDGADDAYEWAAGRWCLSCLPVLIRRLVADRPADAAEVPLAQIANRLAWHALDPTRLASAEVLHACMAAGDEDFRGEVMHEVRLVARSRAHEAVSA